MGYYLLIGVGLIGPFFMIKYREMIGDMMGEADWMRKVGGVHYVVVIVALVIFFWTPAEMTGTTLHTVSRILSAWEQQGLVESGRQRIVIRDLHRLFGIAEDAPE